MFRLGEYFTGLLRDKLKKLPWTGLNMIHTQSDKRTGCVHSIAACVNVALHTQKPHIITMFSKDLKNEKDVYGIFIFLTGHIDICAMYFHDRPLGSLNTVEIKTSQHSRK
jgi:hypothetical protein